MGVVNSKPAVAWILCQTIVRKVGFLAVERVLIHSSSDGPGIIELKIWSNKNSNLSIFFIFYLDPKLRPLRLLLRCLNASSGNVAIGLPSRANNVNSLIPLKA